MKVVDYWTEEEFGEVDSVEEGCSLIQSLEKEAEMYGWDKPHLDIVDSNENSIWE